MEQFFSDIWKILMTALMAVIGWQWREAHALKTKVAVLENTVNELQEITRKDKEDAEKAVKHLQENVAKDIDNIKKDIEKIQSRQDSHSKKQDEIVTLITDFKLAVVKQIGELSSDVKVLTSSLEVYDEGLRVKKKKGK
jgi:translation initiation factor 2B subunit (eIF-2B alpha/beta/delta family)